MRAKGNPSTAQQQRASAPLARLHVNETSFELQTPLELPVICHRFHDGTYDDRATFSLYIFL